MGSKMKAAAIAIVVAAGIQFIPVDRSNPPATAEITSPPQVVEILRSSCFDCHSNRTRWPWYARVAPVSWLLADHVGEARGEFNLSEWNDYPAQRQAEVKRKMREEIDGGEMPLWTYTLLHPGARLTPEQMQRFHAWTRPAGGEDAGEREEARRYGGED